MSKEKNPTHSNIDFETFLNFLKEIESELRFGLLIQKTDYQLIDSVALKLMQLDKFKDSILSKLDDFFIEDKNKYERACLVLNNSINESMEALGYHKDWEPTTVDDDDDDDNVINEDDPISFLIIHEKIINRLNTKKGRLKITECITCYIFKLYSIKENIQDSNKSKKIETATIIPFNPLSLLREEIISLFIDAEKKALDNKLKFSSTIRCAAFCELLYARNYFRTTKTKIKTLTSFALAKYGLDIRISLASSKLTDRKNHQEKTVSKATPLKNCF